MARDVGAGKVGQACPTLGSGATCSGRTTLADPETGRHRLGIGIGEYEMRPIDQAVGFATFAGGGIHATRTSSRR